MIGQTRASKKTVRNSRQDETKMPNHVIRVLALASSVLARKRDPAIGVVSLIVKVVRLLKVVVAHGPKGGQAEQCKFGFHGFCCLYNSAERDSKFKKLGAGADQQVD